MFGSKKRKANEEERKGNNASSLLSKLVHYEKAVDYDPKNPTHWYNIGECLFAIAQGKHVRKFLSGAHLDEEYDIESHSFSKRHQLNTIHDLYSDTLDYFLKVEELGTEKLYDHKLWDMEDLPLSLVSHYSKIRLYCRLGFLSGKLDNHTKALKYFRKQKELIEIPTYWKGARVALPWADEDYMECANVDRNLAYTWTKIMEESLSKGFNYYDILNAYVRAKISFADAIEFSAGDNQISLDEKVNAERFNEIMKQNGKRDRAGSVWQCPECGEEEDMDSAAKHYWEFHYE
tara:strand:+ start:98 stop:967 length:870 start_codon:yes stop_codon:yes gene_type:complete